MDAASLYLLLAIGLKGGVELAEASLADLWLPAVATLSLGLLIPVGVFAAGRGPLRLGIDDASSLAAHYGSVSVVTFTAAVTLLEARDVEVEGFMTTLLAMLEVPGIVVALALARSSARGGFGPAVRETLTGKSVMLLLGGLAIGALAGPERFERAGPGVRRRVLRRARALPARPRALRRAQARRRARDGLAPRLLRRRGADRPGSARHASRCCGGPLRRVCRRARRDGSERLVHRGSAAVRVALPRASPALSLVPALCITFPFNLVVGIPLFYALARLDHVASSGMGKRARRADHGLSLRLGDDAACRRDAGRPRDRRSSSASSPPTARPIFSSSTRRRPRSAGSRC